MNTIDDKLSCEIELDRFISELEARKFAPGAWEMSSILHALASHIAGLYWLSKTDIVLARTPVADRSPSFEPNDDLDHYSLESIRKLFEKIRSFPLLVTPILGPIKLTNDASDEVENTL